MRPEITVLMSCYNAENWLEEAVESVLSQTYSNFEFILVDDGSKDETLGIIRKYEKSDSRIKVITKVNTGLSDSLNAGIAQAQGLWTARLDADDISEPTRLEKQLAFISSNPQTVLLGTGFLEIDADGVIIKQHQYPSGNKVLRSHLEKCLRFFPHSSAFYRTADVQMISGYNKKYTSAQDWDLWLRLSDSGEIACLNEPLVRIRQHANQISHAGSGKMNTIEAQMTITSHFLRKLGVIDPTSGDDLEWIRFRNWVELQIDEEGVFEMRRIWLTAREKFFCHNNRLIGGAHFVKQLFNKYKLNDSSLPMRLAQEWHNEIHAGK
jgi:glycosyltransferase involved in cell wall biosynthesis